MIICDVLMPGMNGFDVTRKLKRDFETSHIPIILLTAMSTSENKLEGGRKWCGCIHNEAFQFQIVISTYISTY